MGCEALSEAWRWLERIAEAGDPAPAWDAACAGALAAELAGRPAPERPAGLVAPPAARAPAAHHLGCLEAALARGEDPVARERARCHARWLAHLLDPDDPARLPRVSVVIPLHDAADLVVAAVESCLAQTHPRLEVVVVDDGSTDHPERALAPFAASIRLVRQANRGAAGARNRGIAEARGELVHFLDADDTLDPDAVEQKLAAFRAVPEAELCASRYRSTGGEPAAGKEEGPPFGDAFCPTRDLLATWVRRYPFQTSTVMLPRWLLLETGPFEEDFAQGEDTRYWFRLALRDTRVVAFDRPLGTRRFRRGSLSASESPLGPILFLMAAVALLERPARWPYLGPLFVRIQGRRRWAAIDRLDDARLAALRAELLAAVGRLGYAALPGGLSGRLPLALLEAHALGAAGEPGPFFTRLAPAVREASAGAAPPGVADLRAWLGAPAAPPPEENAPALAVLFAWLDDCAARGALPLPRAELAALAARFPGDPRSRGLALLGRVPSARLGRWAWRGARAARRLRAARAASDTRS